MYRRKIIFLIFIIIFFGTPLTVFSQAAPLPVIRLSYNEKIYEGLQGSFCWPTVKEMGTLCADTVFQNPSDVISIAKEDTLAVEIEASKPPTKVRATIFNAAEIPPGGYAPPAIEEINLDANLVVPFTIHLPKGVYIIYIFGQWVEGDVSYVFKIDVST